MLASRAEEGMCVGMQTGKARWCLYREGKKGKEGQMMLWREAFTQANVTQQIAQCFVFVFLCLQMGRRNDMFRLVVVDGICCDVHVWH